MVPLLRFRQLRISNPSQVAKGITTAKVKSTGLASADSSVPVPAGLATMSTTLASLAVLPEADVPTTWIRPLPCLVAGTSTDALKLPSERVTTERTTLGLSASSTISTREDALNPEPEIWSFWPATALSGASTRGALCGAGAATTAGGGRCVEGVLAEVARPVGAASRAAGAPSCRLVVAGREVEEPVLCCFSVAVADRDPPVLLRPVAGALDVVEVATAVSSLVSGDDARGTAGGGDEACVVLVVAGEGGTVVAGRAVVALVRLPVVVAPFVPFGLVDVVVAGSREAVPDVVLDVPPGRGAAKLPDGAGMLVVVTAGLMLPVEVVVAPSPSVGGSVARGATGELVEVAVEPGTVLVPGRVLALVPGTVLALVPEEVLALVPGTVLALVPGTVLALVPGRVLTVAPGALVELVVGSGTRVGDVVPGGALGAVVEVGLGEAVPELPGALPGLEVGATPATLVEPGALVVDDVDELSGVEEAQGTFA